MAKKNGLRAKALAEAPQMDRGWFSSLDASTASEIRELIAEWWNGGELRTAYPKLLPLCRWIASQPNINVSENTVTRAAKRIIASYEQP